MYYDWAADQGSSAKDGKAGALCIYLAKINKMQLVNSYYLISTITSSYAVSSNFYQQYNVVNGSAYLNGNLALVTAAEVENDFKSDVLKFSNIINKYQFENTDAIAAGFDAANLTTPKELNVQLGYTNGMDYYNRAEFSIKAPRAGTFTINYKPVFEMADNGYINFTVESTDRALDIIEDFSLDKNAKAGSITIKIPAAGNYKLTVCSKYKSSVTLNIATNKNLFYKSGTFFGKATESYEKDIDMPGYIYIPQGVDKLYFSISNSNAGGKGFKTEAHINSAFNIQDNYGNTLKARFVNSKDSALFYIEVPLESAGKFCRITRKFYQYSLVFANVNNFLWYALQKPQPCKDADFTVDVVNKNGTCITQLTATAKTGEFNWEVTDADKIYTFSNQRVVELPGYISTNAIVTLSNGLNCSVTKNMSDDKELAAAKQTCAFVKNIPDVSVMPGIYPNPSTGIFTFLQKGAEVVANQVLVINGQGNIVAVFSNVKQINISNLPAGTYWYKMMVNQKEFSGTLVKL
jgi:hypothetical protein